MELKIILNDAQIDTLTVPKGRATELLTLLARVETHIAREETKQASNGVDPDNFEIDTARLTLEITNQVERLGLKRRAASESVIALPDSWDEIAALEPAWWNRQRSRGAANTYVIFGEKNVVRVCKGTRGNTGEATGAEKWGRLCDLFPLLAGFSDDQRVGMLGSEAAKSPEAFLLHHNIPSLSITRPFAQRAQISELVMIECDLGDPKQIALAVDQIANAS